jgi:hypothetical protein
MVKLSLLLVATAWLATPMYPDQSNVYDFDQPLECSYQSAPCIVPVPRAESPVERENRRYEQRQRELKRDNRKYKRK